MKILEPQRTVIIALLFVVILIELVNQRASTIHLLT